MSEPHTGIVVRATGSWFDVDVSGRVWPSRLVGRFRLHEEKTTSPIVVGDRVDIQVQDDDTATIIHRHDRENALTRRAAGRRVGHSHIIAANIDRAWCVQSVGAPRFNPGFVDRFLVMCASYEVEAGLIINKIDHLEADDDRLSYWCDVYQDAGYPVITCSAVTRQGVSDVREALTNQVSVFSGPSGVGKTSILNQIAPSLNLRTGEVSGRTNKGKHTTTYAELFRLPTGGFLVDTPGLREFGLLDIEADQLAFLMPDLAPYAADCKFSGCTHDHEPGCAVKAAVDTGDIPSVRYDSYLNMLVSARLGDRDVGR